MLQDKDMCEAHFEDPPSRNTVFRISPHLNKYIYSYKAIQIDRVLYLSSECIFSTVVLLRKIGLRKVYSDMVVWFFFPQHQIIIIKHWLHHRIFQLSGVLDSFSINQTNKEKRQHGVGLHLLCFFSNLLCCPSFLTIRSNQCWRYSLRAKADICAGQILQNRQMKANKFPPRKFYACVCVCVCEWLIERLAKEGNYLRDAASITRLCVDCTELLVFYPASLSAANLFISHLTEQNGKRQACGSCRYRIKPHNALTFQGIDYFSCHGTKTVIVIFSIPKAKA